MNPVAKYCLLFQKRGQSPEEFARWALRHCRTLCIEVLEEIGSWPSSEPELAALQRAFR